MATLILGGIGRLVGGKLGGAVGSIIGQRIDQKLIGGKGRQGPRLTDLAVQSSSYGAQIPKLFGTMRVAGTVIWSTDLIESRRKQSNGKGQPKTTVYSYAASFAVALSSRPITNIGRIWADSKLLRGAGDDFKTPTIMRVHHGLDGQIVDPLIAAAEGLANTPAYRGMAYVVFEDFQLADYGNRLPSLSFEVIADPGPVAVGPILAALAGIEVTADTSAVVDGFAASGDSVRGAAEALAAAIPLSLFDDGDHLVIRDAPPPAVALAAETMGASANGKRRERVAIEQRTAGVIPEILSLAYYDPARDHQPGLQTARRDGGTRRDQAVELPAALSASVARTICEARLGSLWAERLTAQVSLGPEAFDLQAGAAVTIPGHDAVWRIAATTLEDDCLTLDLVRTAVVSPVSGGTSGRHLGQPDLPHGPTTLMLLDLPPLTDSPAANATVVVAAAGTSSGWRRAALSVSVDGGASWQDAGSTAAPAIIGFAEGALAAGTSAIVDRINHLTVALLNDAMDLHDADMAALLRGDNLAMVGAEAIQFGRAEPLGNGRWRLSQLLRGRRGTEAAIAGHLPGERFVLIESDALAILDAGLVGPSMQAMAIGIGDPVAVMTSAVPTGASTRPLAPVHLRARRLANGDTAISWIRRSRSGWAWRDGVDAPLAEENERYAITLSPAGLPDRSLILTASEWVYPATERASDGASGASSVTITVRQIGSLAESPASSLAISVV